MSTKHTPGPWFKQESGYEYAIPKRHYVCDGDRREICQLSEHAPEANAALIAAAPDLLEALKEAKSYVSALYQEAYGRALPSNNSVGNVIRAAIAKAEAPE